MEDQAAMDAYAQWVRALPEEIAYWRGYIRGRGAEYPDDFAYRLREDTLVQDRDPVLAETLTALGPKDLRLLDVGAGPLTNLGKRLPAKNLTIYPCDPLADVYGWLLQEADVRPPVSTLFADVENLSMYFPRDSFHAVHCANALDHSYDPLGGILEMLKVLHPRGFIHLGHFENEAEHEAYGGLHQWNLTERDGDFVLWNRREELSLRNIGGDALEVNARRFPLEGGRQWILVQIRKRSGILERLRKHPKVEALYALRPPNLPAKYRTLLADSLRRGLAAIGSAETTSAAKSEDEATEEVSTLPQDAP
jgi:SAM-dependent methyltransferase